MTQTPADALRLVPVEPTREQQLAMQSALLKNYPDVFEGEAYVNGNMLGAIYSAALAAAPASPLPGGGDWIDGTPEVPVGSPAWCAWATHEIMNLRAKPPAAPTGEPK